MLKCDNAEKLIQMAIDGQLSREQRDELDRHAAECGKCERVWEQYRGLARLASDWAAPSIEQRTSDEVYLAQIMGRVRRDRSPVRPWWTIGVVAGSCALLTALSVYLSPIAALPRVSTGDLGLWSGLHWRSLFSAIVALPGSVLHDLIAASEQIRGSLDGVRGLAAPTLCLELLIAAIVLNILIYFYTTRTSPDRLAR